MTFEYVGNIFFACLSIHTVPADGDMADLQEAEDIIELSIHTVPADGDGKARNSNDVYNLSIHTVPADGDLVLLVLFFLLILFQSTPSLRTVTWYDNTD